MLAFEEMRKRLEEQHAQQLSLLIAEQEREQERLQKVRNVGGDTTGKWNLAKDTYEFWSCIEYL